MNSQSQILGNSRFDSLGRRFAFVLIVMLTVVTLGGLGTLIEGKKEVALSQISTADPALHEALESALKNINELRERDRAAVIDCTTYFGDFNRYSEIGRYASFFKGIGISATFDELNGKYYASFYFSFSKLAAMGFRSFLRNDTLVVVFTTASASSKRITSLKCSLLNDGYP